VLPFRMETPPEGDPFPKGVTFSDGNAAQR